MPRSSMAQSTCNQAPVSCVGRGGARRRYGTFEALRPQPNPMQLGSGMGFGVGSGLHLAGRAPWALTRNLGLSCSHWKALTREGSRVEKRPL